MRVKEEVYFAVYSDRLSASEMAMRIGVDPDDVLLKGSRRAEPPVPRRHAWKLRPIHADTGIGEQVDDLLRRLTLLEPAISDLMFDLGDDGGAVLQLVRYLNDTEGVEGRLGFALDASAVALLSRLGANVDVDEYDASPTSAS